MIVERESLSRGDLLRSATGRIAASLNPSHFADQRFAMLTAYYDESGTHDASPINVLAGLCGDVSECARFEREWNKVLRGVNIPYVHAKSMHHRQKIFKNWTGEKIENLHNQLMYVIQEHKGLMITKTILSVKGFDLVYKTPPRESTERLDSKYALCVRSCLHFIANLAFDRDDENPVANFVLEDGHRNAGDAVRVWKEVRADRRLPWTQAVGALSFAGKSGNPLLQAADLLAYSIFKNETAPTEDKSWTSDAEYDLQQAGLIVANHLITKDDLLNLRFNMKLGLPQHNVFRTTKAHFDSTEYYGWKERPDEFAPVIIVDANPDYVRELRRKIPRRFMTKSWH